ncbi:hypothetical protein GOODEAATRI_028590 [Goodea atripinnis]|uniref:Uncharacterized protein n=1 Tax=Goodea atripinnis TaxID=208336 RepID=A0ABV0PHV8_9TELE
MNTKLSDLIIKVCHMTFMSSFFSCFDPHASTGVMTYRSDRDLFLVQKIMVIGSPEKLRKGRNLWQQKCENYERTRPMAGIGSRLWGWLMLNNRGWIPVLDSSSPFGNWTVGDILRLEIL